MSLSLFRRALLGAGALLTTDPGVRRPRAAAHPDGELLALVDQFRERETALLDAYFAAEEEASARGMSAIKHTRLMRAQVQANVAEDAALEAMLHQIASLYARTPAGLAAKALVVQRWIGEGWDVQRVPTEDPWERVAYSLARDVLLAGKHP